MSKGVSANLMQSGSKRRRTKKQIEEDKQAEFRKEDESANAMAELASLRAQVRTLGEQVETGKIAASYMSQMINAGHVVQDSADSVVIKGANG